MSSRQTQILLVEDNPNDIELTLHALRENRIENPVVIARDGVEALERAFEPGTIAFGLILLDLKLPKLDGLEVLRRLKGDPRTRHVPIVMLTSSQEESDLVESYDLGVNSYIVKPVDFSQLIEAVKVIGMYWLLLNVPPPPAPSTGSSGV